MPRLALGRSALHQLYGTNQSTEDVLSQIEHDLKGSTDKPIDVEAELKKPYSTRSRICAIGN